MSEPSSKSNSDVGWMMVKSEVTVLERNLAIYSDMTTSPWLPKKGFVRSW